MEQVQKGRRFPATDFPTEPGSNRTDALLFSKPSFPCWMRVFAKFSAFLHAAKVRGDLEERW